MINHQQIQYQPQPINQNIVNKLQPVNHQQRMNYQQPRQQMINQQYQNRQIYNGQQPNQKIQPTMPVGQ